MGVVGRFRKALKCLVNGRKPWCTSAAGTPADALEDGISERAACAGYCGTSAPACARARVDHRPDLSHRRTLVAQLLSRRRCAASCRRENAGAQVDAPRRAARGTQGCVEIAANYFPILVRFHVYAAGMAVESAV